MLNWINPKNWSIVKVYRDFENYIDWIKIIKKEEANPTSKYNLWKLKHTKLYDLYIIVSLDDEDAQLPENIKKVKVIESLNSLHLYLDEELGFAGNLTVEFNQFYDDNGKPTLSYLVVYRFDFKAFSIKWLIKFILIVSLLIYLINKYDVISILTKWVSNLI